MRYTNESGWTDFKKLFAEGQAGEEITLKYLESKGYTQLITIDDAMKEDSDLSKSDWDIRGVDPSGNVKLFEVKTQNRCHEYNGCNIELTQNGKDSGLITTLSDWYVFVNPEFGFGFVRTSRLKAIYDNGMIGMKKYRTWAKNPASGWIQPHSQIFWIK